MTLMTERPITISGTEPPSFEGLLNALDQLDLPDGYRAEIIKGNIVVSPKVTSSIRRPSCSSSQAPSVRTDRTSTPRTSGRWRPTATASTEKASPSSPS